VRQADIERLLPGVIQRTATPGSPLDALLAVMDVLHAPAEAALAELGDTFHPYRCPDRFVPYLAGWVDVDRFLTDDGTGEMGLSSGLGALRELVAAAARLARRRGTAAGLVELLELATGVRGFAVDEEVRDAAGAVRPFVVRVRVPAAAAAHRGLVERIADAEKPAHVECDLVYPLPPPPQRTAEG
jgi:phage tail-like protein